MATRREAETVMNSGLVRALGWTTLFISVVTFFLFVAWLLSEEQGGFGPRDDRWITAQYFNWHPLLMSATFFLCVTPAVCTFETYPCSRNANKWLHATYHTFGCICIVGGLYIILDCHLNLRYEPRVFQSIHALCGYVVFGLFCLNYLFGLCVFGCRCGGDVLRRSIMPYHKRFGLFVAIAGYANILLGLSQAVKPSQLAFGQLLAGFVLLTLLLVILTVVNFMNKKEVRAEYVATDVDDVDDQTDDDRVQT